MFRKLKLKSKLLLSFFIITCISTAATTSFAIYYFSHKIHDEAIENMRKHIRVADLVYKNKVFETKNTVTTMANEGGLQVLVSLMIRNKINEYLEKTLQNNAKELHQVVIVNAKQERLGEANISKFAALNEQDYQDNELIRQALARGKAVAATEQIQVGEKTLLAISAAVPIIKSSNIMSAAKNNDQNDPAFTGAILARYILNDGDVLLDVIHSLLDVTAAFYYQSHPIKAKLSSEQAQPDITPELYQELMSGNPEGTAEAMDLEFGGQLAEYKVLTDIFNKPVAILGINITANRYAITMQRAIENLVLIMVLCIVFASLLGYLLARSILVPIYELLTGVKRVTSGDLSHEIMINLEIKDELGTLANSFNSMSRQLNDLFCTLEQRVEDATHRLQNTLAHMTAIIDNMADGLLVTDEKGCIIRYNPALSAMFPEQRNMQNQLCQDVFSEEIAEIARHSRSLSEEIHEVELSLANNRYAKAVATAIVQKDATDKTKEEYIGSRYIGTVILIRDITREKEIDRMMKNTIETLTRVGTALSSEKDINLLLELCVSEARSLSNADAGTLYILEKDHLAFKIVQNQSLGVALSSSSVKPQALPPISLLENRFAAQCAQTKQIISAGPHELNNEYEQFSFFSGYHIERMLVVPMLDRMQNTIGVLQLLNPLDSKTGKYKTFTNNQIEIVKALASQAAVSIDNARNYQKIERKNIASKRFVPTEFLLRLGHKEIEDVQLGNASQEHMSVLFADIRSFTNISERLTPQDNFNFLNDYLQHIGPNISANGGFIDKYIGDAIMALFPGMRMNIGHDAVAAAVGIMRALKKLNEQREKRFLSPIRLGIGIHSGPLTLGIIGFESRLESTVIGDSVNLASRMEGLTKQYGINIGITASTLSYLTMSEGFLVREIDTVQVKGKEEPVTVYEVFDADPEPLRDYKEATLIEYHEALDLYKEQSWREALALFKGLSTRAPEDHVVKMYYQRCQQLLNNPPTEWSDGVTRLDYK